MASLISHESAGESLMHSRQACSELVRMTLNRVGGLSKEMRNYEYDASQSLVTNSWMGRIVTSPTCRRRASRHTQR